jgi:hypothetical protein
MSRRQRRDRGDVGREGTDKQMVLRGSGVAVTSEEGAGGVGWHVWTCKRSRVLRTDQNVRWEEDGGRSSGAVHAAGGAEKEMKFSQTRGVLWLPFSCFRGAMRGKCSPCGLGEGGAMWERARARGGESWYLVRLVRLLKPALHSFSEQDWGLDVRGEWNAHIK